MLPTPYRLNSFTRCAISLRSQAMTASVSRICPKPTNANANGFAH